MTPSLLGGLTPHQKLEKAEACSEFVQSRSFEVIFEELEQRMFSALKVHSSNSEELVNSIRYLNTIKQQIEYWANSVKTYQEEVKHG